MAHHDETLIDKVKHALGMDDQDQGASLVTEDVAATGIGAESLEVDDLATTAAEPMDDRAGGWAGVPEALYDDTSAGTHPTGDPGTDEAPGLGRSPGPLGTPEELGGTDFDPEGSVNPTREDIEATEYGGDDTPMPTASAWDRGEAPVGEADFGTDDDLDRRETGI